MNQHDNVRFVGSSLQNMASLCMSGGRGSVSHKSIVSLCSFLWSLLDSEDLPQDLCALHHLFALHHVNVRNQTRCCELTNR